MIIDINHIITDAMYKKVYKNIIDATYNLSYVCDACDLYTFREWLYDFSLTVYTGIKEK